MTATRDEIVAVTNLLVDDLKALIPKVLNTIGGFAALEIPTAQNALMQHVKDIEAEAEKAINALDALRTKGLTKRSGVMAPEGF